MIIDFNNKKVMQKLILHFGEDVAQKNLYNLILKVVDIPTDQSSFSLPR